MKECTACKRMFPNRFVHTLVTNEGYFPICAKCADKIMVGLQGEISTQVLKEQLEWERRQT